MSPSAMPSTIWPSGRSSSEASAWGRAGVSSMAEYLRADEIRAVAHGLELGAGDVRGQVAQAAVGIDQQPIGRQHVQAAPDASRHHLGRLHLEALDVDDAQAERQLVRPMPAEQLQVVVASTGELQHQL